VVAVARRSSDDDVGTLSSALALQALLSLLPLVLLVGSVLGFLVANDPVKRADWADRLAGAIPGLRELVGRNLNAAVTGRYAAGIVAVGLLIWRGSALTGSATHMLARIFRTAPRGVVKRRLRALATLATLGTCGLASAALTVVATAPGRGPVLGVLGVIAGAAADFVFFAIAYRELTPGGPPIRDHLPGALAMTVSWTVLKIAGSWFASLAVSRASALYGTAGAVFGVLAVLLLGSRSFLYGAEISAVVQEARSDS
jgi:membrane protein